MRVSPRTGAVSQKKAAVFWREGVRSVGGDVGAGGVDRGDRRGSGGAGIAGCPLGSRAVEEVRWK